MITPKNPKGYTMEELINRAGVQKSDGSMALQVDANIVVEDIEIGAVEIKDGVSDTRAVVENLGGGNALDVNVVSGDIEIAIVGLKNIAGSQINPATEDGNLASIKTKTDNLDVLLSTRALEAGGNLASIKSKTDNLDVTLSSVITGIAGATAKTLFDIWTLINAGINAVVTGTVSVSNMITGYATSVIQTDGSQKTQIVDGSANVIGSTVNALDINIKSGNPTAIQANAGTNLNTSALALESGGNLASVKTNTDNLNGRTIPVVSVTATASGDTILRTPTAGKKTRIRYVMFNNAGAVDITVYFKSATTGNVYQCLLKPGAFFATSIGINNNYHELGINEICYINLSAVGTVYASIRYEEV